MKLKDKLEFRNSLTTQSRLAPKICGKYIRILRNKVKLSQKKLDKIVGRSNFTVELETGRGRSSVTNVVKVINYFQSNKLTNKMKELHYLKQIISNNYLLKKPYKINFNKIENGLVSIMTSNSLLINTGLIIDGTKAEL